MYSEFYNMVFSTVYIRVYTAVYSIVCKGSREVPEITDRHFGVFVK